MIAAAFLPHSLGSTIGQRYRYTAPDRTTDEASTKAFRRRMRALTFEILSENGAIANCKGSDGNYYAQLPLWYLKPIEREGEL